MSKVMKKIVLLMLLAFIPLLVMAHPAQEVVENSTHELMGILKNDKERLLADKAYLMSVVEEKLVPHLDVDAMTALSMGKNWRAASKQQRLDLVTEFKLLLLNTYTSALALYTGQKLEFKPFKPGKREDRAVVRSLFLQNAGKGVPVNYKLRKKDGRWRIYDIDVNNLNLVSTYRSTFAQKVAQVGIDGLIEEMRQRNAKSAKK
jgi:phospholipid transport system substrate-binding protein